MVKATMLRDYPVLQFGVILWASLVALVIDQVSKYLIFKFVDTPHIICAFLRIVKLRNPGAAFGLMGNLPGGNFLLGILSLLTVMLLLIFEQVGEQVLVYR